MCIFDIIIISLLLITAILGFRKGFILQLFGLLAVFLGVYCAYKFSGIVVNLISNWMVDTDETLLSVVAFIVTMLLVWICIILLGRFINAILKISALSFINRMLGLLFATVQTLFICSVLVLAFSYLNISKNKEITNDLQKSKLYEPMKYLAKSAFPYINFNKLNEI